MFASNEKNVGKKSFQKPNILRRKGKASVSKANISNITESPEETSLVTIPPVQSTNISNPLDNITKLEGSTKSTNETDVWGLPLAKYCEDKQNNLLKSLETDIHANFSSNASNTKFNNEGLEQNAFNIEYFINNAGSIEQDVPLTYESSVPTEKKTTQAKPKWSFDITNNSMDIIINNYKAQEFGDLEEKLDSVIVVPTEPVSEQRPEQAQQVAAVTSPQTTQSIAANYSNRAVKFKCDQPNCTKGFWSEEKLKKHKNSHKRQAYRTPTQITYECPVKKKGLDGSEEKCPRTFEVRGDMLKHLNDDHTLDDAQHRCERCGRRFFWALGLRAHGTSACARGGLACAWPGCGRVFRLPCRLREHARAHTGDRPYLCRYPDCGWAFRSASKLLRHARRHTDERRHACTTCGRAFLRREHLRDHAARYHLRAARATHHCTHPGCEQSFTNMSTLYMHMKKVHRKGKEVTVAPVAEDTPANVNEDEDYVYLVSLPDNVVIEEEESKAVSSVSAEEGAAGVADRVHNVDEDVAEQGSAEHMGERDSVEPHMGERDAAQWHAARTHCTWPLARAAHAHYVLDDDVQVELAEGSVSDVYTVRSDLFLHGNVPIDDDSQQIVGAALSGEAGAGAMDADLCLIDAHPTIDLMQEELMYEDAADESSFRVFLMNGEELT